MSWREELDTLLQTDILSDFDIEVFTRSHIKVRSKDIWDYVYEYYAPNECKGCSHIQMSGMYPCIKCSRIVKLKDHYEARKN